MSIKSNLPCSALCVVFLTAGGLAHAQTATEAPAAGSEGSLEEIVVTAQKRAENLQKVPIAISAVTSEQLQTSGVDSLLNLNAVVPGVTLLDIGDQVAARIRGVGSTVINIGQEAPVAIYIDNVYYADSADVGGSLADVSQVSVLKGPQGTLFGRNATGGVIQIATRDPTDEYRADVTTDVDNYRTWRSSVYAGGPVASDLKAGLALQYATQQDGWGRNVYDGEEVHKINSDFTGRGKLIFTPTDSTTIRIAADYTHTAGSTAGVFRPFPGFPAAYASAEPSNPWSTNSYIQPYDAYQGGGASINLQQDLGFANFTSISAYRRSIKDWAFTTPGTAIPALDLTIDDFSRQFTEELQLVSKTESPLSWATGLFYINNFAGQNPLDINIRPGPYRGDGALSQVIIDTAQKLNSIAGFGQTTYTFTSATRLTTGLRYTYEKKSLFGYENGVLAADPSVTIPLFQAGTSALSSNDPTWRLSLDHDFWSGGTGYISYNRGFKSGGFNVRDPTNPPFQPEKLDAYEIGLKTQFLDDRVRLNSAVFDYEYKNVQVARYTTNTVIYNGAGARLYGLDIDGQARLTSRLQINASVSLLHSYFTSFPDAFTSSYVLTPTGAIISLYTASATGKTLPYSPSVTSTVSVDYEIPSAFGPFKLNLTDFFSSKFYAEADNVLTQPSYQYLDASVAWKSENGRYGVRIYGNNLLNKAVFSQAGSLTTGYEVDYPNPPCIYGVKFELSY